MTEIGAGPELPASATSRCGPAASIEVVLATFNSEPFLAELFDSLFSQSRQDFKIIVADDGSTDGSLDVIGRYQRLYPGRIDLVWRGTKTDGPCRNFARLLDGATADYVFFCDHDDVWLQDKIAASLDAMRALEGEHGASTPLLLHTDLIVVGPGLQPISNSAFDYQNVDPDRNSLSELLMTNTVTGCTALVNRALCERARPVPPEALMHDHWLALVASAVGKIGFLTRGLVLYRQHGRNAIGATRWGLATIIDQGRQLLFGDAKRRLIRMRSGQALVLLARFGHEMKAAEYRATEALANIWSVSRWKRFSLLSRNGLRFGNWVRNLGLMVTMMMMSRKDV